MRLIDKFNIFGLIVCSFSFIFIMVNLALFVVSYVFVKDILAILTFIGIFYFLYELTGDEHGNYL